MNTKYRNMLIKLSKNILVSVVFIFVVITLILVMASCIFGRKLSVGGFPLLVAILGTLLAFAGNSLMIDATTRYDSSGLPHYKWGSYLQIVGYGLMIAALIIK